MAWSNVALIFAHPGHELVVGGMLQRFRPHVLYVTRADSAGGSNREVFAREVLNRFGLAQRASFLNVSEIESYARAFAGDIDWYREVGQRIGNWLHAVRPDVVMGDAYEMYNFHHDLTRAMLDAAIRHDPGLSCITNYEIPLTCRVDADLQALRYQYSPLRPIMNIRLTAAELDVKMAVIRWITERFPYVGQVAGHFPVEREYYRFVPPERDYSQPAVGVRPHYDEWGLEQVRRGKYARALRFEEHFVPLVRGLDVTGAQPLRHAA